MESEVGGSARSTALSRAFVYESFSWGRKLDRLLKCSLLFFDKVAVKLSEDQQRGHQYDYLFEPMRDAHVLEIVSADQVLTPHVLELQNQIVLNLTLEGAFDYLGPNPYWGDFAKLTDSPFRFLSHAISEHRAFLAPVAEELLRRKLAVPVGTKIPDDLRAEFEGKGRHSSGGERPTYYDGPIAEKLPTAIAQRGTVFPFFSHVNLIEGQTPVEIDGKPFLQLAVHPDVAFVHEEIVRMVVYNIGVDGLRYHAFTDLNDRSRVNRFLGMLPSSGYSAIVMTDLEQVTVDLATVPLDELISFRDQHRHQFAEYRIGLAAAVHELSLCEHPSERTALLLQRQDEFATLAKELKRACRQAFGLRLGASSVGAVGIAWAIRQHDPVAAAVSAASALLGIRSVSEPFSHIRYLHDIQGTFGDR